ncbi:MAG: metallophosphoesterase, partial [Gemmatimonadota bacterium]
MGRSRWLVPGMAAMLAVAGLATAPAGGSESTAGAFRTTVAEVNPWTHLRAAEPGATYHFAVVADRTGDHRAGVFASAMDQLNLLQPAFAVSVGDLIEGYTEDEEQIRLAWEEVLGMVGRLEMPFFFLPGNHDLGNDALAAAWRQRFGRTYYHFVYGKALFLCLDAEDGASGRIGERQREDVAAMLAAHPEVGWTFVFLHEPLWKYPEEAGWPAVEALLGNRPHTVFAGHWHGYLKEVRDGHEYYTLATTGAASALTGPAYGQFDQIAWVTVTAEGPRVANLRLEGVLDDSVRTPETAALIDPLYGQYSVSVDPVMAAGTEFTEGITKLRVRNMARLPLRVRGGIGGRGGLYVRPDTVEVVVAPGQQDSL